MPECPFLSNSTNISLLRPTDASGKTSKLPEEMSNTHLCVLREGLKAVMGWLWTPDHRLFLTGVLCASMNFLTKPTSNNTVPGDWQLPHVVKHTFLDFKQRMPSAMH